MLRWIAIAAPNATTARPATARIQRQREARRVPWPAWRGSVPTAPDLPAASADLVGVVGGREELVVAGAVAVGPELDRRRRRATPGAAAPSRRRARCRRRAAGEHARPVRRRAGADHVVDAEHGARADRGRRRATPTRSRSRAPRPGARRAVRASRAGTASPSRAIGVVDARVRARSAADATGEQPTDRAAPSRRRDRRRRPPPARALGRPRQRARYERGPPADEREERPERVALRLSVPSKSNAATRRRSSPLRHRGRRRKTGRGAGGAGPTSRSAAAPAPTSSRSRGRAR